MDMQVSRWIELLFQKKMIDKINISYKDKNCITVKTSNDYKFYFKPNKVQSQVGTILTDRFIDIFVLILWI